MIISPSTTTPEERFGQLVMEMLSAIATKDQVRCCESARLLLFHAVLLSLRERVLQTRSWPDGLIEAAQALVKVAASECADGSRYQVNVLDRFREFNTLRPVLSNLDSPDQVKAALAFRTLLHLLLRELDREVREKSPHSRDYEQLGRDALSEVVAHCVDFQESIDERWRFTASGGQETSRPWAKIREQLVLLRQHLDDRDYPKQRVLDEGGRLGDELQEAFQEFARSLGMPVDAQSAPSPDWPSELLLTSRMAARFQRPVPDWVQVNRQLSPILASRLTFEVQDALAILPCGSQGLPAQTVLVDAEDTFKTAYDVEAPLPVMDRSSQEPQAPDDPTLADAARALHVAPEEIIECYQSGAVAFELMLSGEAVERLRRFFVQRNQLRKLGPQVSRFIGRLEAPEHGNDSDVYRNHLVAYLLKDGTVVATALTAKELGNQLRQRDIDLGEVVIGDFFETAAESP